MPCHVSWPDCATHDYSFMIGETIKIHPWYILEICQFYNLWLWWICYLIFLRIHTDFVIRGNINYCFNYFLYPNLKIIKKKQLASLKKDFLFLGSIYKLCFKFSWKYSCWGYTTELLDHVNRILGFLNILFPAFCSLFGRFLALYTLNMHIMHRKIHTVLELFYKYQKSFFYEMLYRVAEISCSIRQTIFI